MAKRTERIGSIARKEFTDHLTSGKFLLLMILYLIIVAYALHSGMDYYLDQLERYIHAIQYSVPVYDILASKREIPTILMIFGRLGARIALFGPIIAIAMGFDLLSEEKMTGSLKTLLSHPVHRDEIINGKALGGVYALLLIAGIPLILAIAVLLIAGILPAPRELGIILIFGVVTLLFLFAYFSIALACSSIAEDSGKALVYAMAVFIALSVLVPMVGERVADAASGDYPEYVGMNAPLEEKEQYLEESNAYNRIHDTVRYAFNAFSPNKNYSIIYCALFYDSHGLHYENTVSFDEPDLMDLIGKFWPNIIALFVFPVVFFALAYVRFMRMDIR